MKKLEKIYLRKSVRIKSGVLRILYRSLKPFEFHFRTRDVPLNFVYIIVINILDDIF